MYMATPEEDAIEILSSYTENTSVFNVSPRTESEIDPEDRLVDTPIPTASFVIRNPPLKKREKTKKQKLVSRIVFGISVTLLAMSLLLVGISFNMTQHIDDLAAGRTSHSPATWSSGNPPETGSNKQVDTSNDASTSGTLNDTLSVVPGNRTRESPIT